MHRLYVPHATCQIIDTFADETTSPNTPTVIVWGSNSEQQLGIPKDPYATRCGPTLLPIKIPARKVACGFYHTMVLGNT